MNFFFPRYLSVLFLLSFVTPPVMAEDLLPYTYELEACEFAISLPSEPVITNQCDADGGRCYDQLTYTNVFDINSTVRFKVICNAIDPTVIESYSGDIMQATLKAMTKRAVVTTYDVSFEEKERYKYAGLVGEGQTGALPTLYVAQLWIGERSAFTVEADLIGQAAKAPDEMFGQILKSIHFKDDKMVDTPPADTDSLDTTTE